MDYQCKGVVDKTFTMLTQDETSKITVKPLVCLKHPQLHKMFERANNLGLNNLAETIASLCNILESS